jgi:hypothetical protein
VTREQKSLSKMSDIACGNGAAHATSITELSDAPDRACPAAAGGRYPFLRKVLIRRENGYRNPSDRRFMLIGSNQGRGK